MTIYTVTRAHLKSACDHQAWDLLDKLLELDPSQINDNSLYTDTWGEWWGLLLETIGMQSVTGVRVLLAHGAQRDLASWGDCMPRTPLEAAAGQPDILALLQSSQVPAYQRITDPPLPQGLSPAEQGANRQGEIRNSLGLAFQASVLQQPE